jgi:hypothetical protein
MLLPSPITAGIKHKAQKAQAILVAFCLVCPAQAHFRVYKAGNHGADCLRFETMLQ